MRFEVFRGKFRRRWYWRLVADNGEVIAQSEGYHNRADALSTVRLIQTRAGETDVVVLP